MSKVVTKTEVRLSYTNLIDPRQRDDEHPDELVYSTAILIPKTDVATVDAIKNAIKEALAEGIAKKWGGKAPKGLKNPLRDGDEEREDDEVYKGHYFINAKGPRGGKEKPILLTAAGAETSDGGVIYSGVHARVSLQFYAFDVNGNKGVACGVSAVQSAEHGEPLGSTVTAASARAEFGIETAATSAAAEFSDAPKSAEAASGADEEDVWG